MPDAFFQKKRKRTTSSTSSPRAGPSRSQPSIKSNASTRMRKSRNASDSSDNDDDAVPGGGIDEMDLTHRYDEGPNSDDEAEAAETPAEARVRLAKMYLQGLSSSAPAAQRGDGEGDDFFETDDTPSFGLADAAQADRDNIAARLQKDVAEQSGKIHLFLANRIAAPTTSTTTPNEADEEAQNAATVNYDNSLLALRGHRLSVTCAVASPDAKWLFTASKDGSIIRWRLRDGKMMRIHPKRAKFRDENGAPAASAANNRSKSSGAARRRARFSHKTGKSTDSTSLYLSVGEGQGHTDEVWTLSLSSDGQYLASGGADRRVCIWSATPSSESFLKTLSGHKDSITSLSFRTNSHELLTASLDRTLKLYDVSQLSYIETLFGHQESVLSLSCLSSETAVSAGGRDRTCRFWKIRDESQLVFRAGIKSKLREVLEGGDLSQSDKGAMSAPHEAMEGSVEVVAMIDNQHFLSGGDSGTISLWNLGKKKPIFSHPVAHGFEVTKSESEGEIRTPRWITALASLPFGDVFVSGSWDGSVRVWGLNTAGGGGQVKGFRELFALPAEGVINSLQLVSPPLSTVQVEEETGLVSSTAVRASEYKRRAGLHTNPAEKEEEEEEEGNGEGEKAYSKLPRLGATKDNSPPIIIAAVGQEHRLGRWLKQPQAKNGTLVIPLLLSSASTTTTTKTNKGFKLM